ncbi:MAG TPA: DUF3644 domain-containing protein [Ktedonobacteraceae bacterium]|nr:DUF3644 domain-containing protein [Ktedonobacteraceae bacterium]
MVVRKNAGKISKAYSFFKNAENSKLHFTVEDISKATGWSMQTVKAYRTKKWSWFLEEAHGLLTCREFHNMYEDVFFRIHAQRADIDIRNLRPHFSQMVDDLLDKARESALLAVQTYNNPSAKFRTPGYLALMHIAYTALFHAIFEHKGVDYLYKDANGNPIILDGDTRAWELSECADFYYKGETLPERENLRLLTKLRNKIEHRYLPQLDLTLSGHCQASLLNFEILLKKEFGPFFALGQSLALALQFSEIEPFQREIIKHTQAQEYDTIRTFIDAYQSNLPLDVLQSPQYSFRVYLIPRIGNHATSSDHAIEFVHYDPTKPEEMRQYEKDVAMIRERRVPVADQGKLRPTKVVKRVKDATGVSFTVNDHTKAWKLYNVRSKLHTADGCKTEYCQYSEAFNEYIYTEQWVAFLIKKVQDPKELQKIKAYKDL